MKLSLQTIKTSPDLVAKFEAIFQTLTTDKKPAFLDILNQTELRKKCKTVFKSFESVEDVIVLGIGGSSLGGKTLAQIFRKSSKVHFFENVDGYDFFKNLEKIKNIDKAHFVVISKSGSTLETLAQLNFLIQYFSNENKNIKSRTVVITEMTPSPLYDWALAQKIPMLEIPVQLGGRFSVLSPVGLYPALFMDVDIDKLSGGGTSALQMSQECSQFCAQIIESFERQEMITVFWSYSDSLKNFGFWIQQLWAESLGKQFTRDNEKAPYASTPLPLIGTNDQHSILQQIIEGQKDKFIVFLRSMRDETFGSILSKNYVGDQKYLLGKKLGDILHAQYMGTQNALQSQDVHSLTIEIKDLSEESVGRLFVFFQLCVAMLGEYHNINTYDQPGVEKSKKIAVDLLKST